VEILVYKLFTATVNLILPGMGLCLSGRLHWALLTQGCLLLTVALLCWSRLVFTPAALLVGLIFIGFIYVVSSGLCLYADHKQDRQKWWHSLLFTAVSLGLLSVGFGYKQHLLGAHVYFVPSMSMHPTLKPGQFILIDTWIYDDQKPSINDVVVFRHEESGQWLVKRISPWPDGKTQNEDLWYVLGDNSSQSRDSRYFGGIATDQIVGQVRLILAGIDQENRFVPESFGVPIH